LETVDVIVELINKSQEKEQQTNDFPELTEQKLKFELGLLSSKLEQQTAKNKYNQFIILGLIIVFSITLILMVFFYRKFQHRNILY
ncbi:hypothetical protein, partial [Psychrobacter sp. 16-MNA-CIBAN-0192]